MDGNSVVQLGATGGFATIVAAVIGAIAGQRVQKANAGNIAVQSADTQISNLEGENKYLREDRDAERARANREATKNRRWWERADRLAPWIRRQEQRLVDAGVHDPAPALYPPDGE